MLTTGGKRIYVAGDTEDTAEMRSLKGIDIAFLPMNMPYTMSVQEAAEVTVRDGVELRYVEMGKGVPPRTRCVSRSAVVTDG